MMSAATMKKGSGENDLLPSPRTYGFRRENVVGRRYFDYEACQLGKAKPEKKLQTKVTMLLQDPAERSA